MLMLKAQGLGNSPSLNLIASTHEGRSACLNAHMQVVSPIQLRTFTTPLAGIATSSFRADGPTSDMA